MAVAGSASPAWERRVTTFSLVALAGGALMVVGSFLTWVQGPVESFSGWELYDLRNEAGDNPFVIDEMFRSTFNPFFTGGTTVFLGVVVTVLALLALWLPKRPPPSRLRISTGLYVAMVLTMLAAILVLAIDFLSYNSRDPGTEADLAFGFWVTALGAVATAFGFAGAANPSKKESPAESEQAPPMTVPRSYTPISGGPAGGGAPAPDWYPDPIGRHQVRYWDGQAWTTHVADAGTRSEDPVGVA